MRKITETKTFNVYKYNELSTQIQEKIRDNFIHFRCVYDCDEFTDNCLEQLKTSFPNSDLDVQYSLNYRQGDGLNIYGDLDLSDMLEHIKDNFSDKELKYLKWVLSEFSYDYHMLMNSHYFYCICDRHDYMEDIKCYMEDDNIRNIRYDVLEKFNKHTREYMCDLCYQFEKAGYYFFYDSADNEENYSDMEFLEDGTEFFEDDNAVYA